MLARGRPSGAQRRFSISRGSPWIHSAKDGEATRPLSLMASLGRSFSGEKAIEVFTSDDDPELVRDAFPFGLKTYELLIAEDPENPALYLAAAAGFVQ